MKIDRRDFLLSSSSALVFSQTASGVKGQAPATVRSSKSSPLADRKITVFTTAKDTDQRISQTATLGFKRMGQPLETQTCVFVDRRRRFQTFLGIGGAITDSSAETLAKIPAAKQKEVIDAYFDPGNGIAYTLARTNIHSRDFSSACYTYVDEGDKELRTFSGEHDRKFRIPMIKRAMEAARGTVKLCGSPWSPPEPGAKRIATSPSRSSLISTAFVNPDGKVSVVVMNRGEKPVEYHLWLSGDATAVTCPARSIQTLVF